MKVIPIERASLRRLPDVVDAVADRLRAGQTVVAFPEGTTWCGLAYGPFRPAMFQAAIDAGRPVQPLRLSYHHRDGSAVDGRRLRRRRHPDGVDPPAGHRPPHDRARARRVAAAAGRPTGVTWPRRCEAAVRGDTRRDGRTGTRWWPDRGFRAAVARRYHGTVMTASVGLPGSRRHHPDAPRCHRGDDGCAGDGRQRLVAARHRPGGAAPDGGVARDAGQTARRAPVGGDLHRGRHRERQPGRQGHLLGAPRRRTAPPPHHHHRGRTPRGARLGRMARRTRRRRGDLAADRADGSVSRRRAARRPAGATTTSRWCR